MVVNNSLIIQDAAVAANIAAWCGTHLSMDEWNLEAVRFFPVIYKFTINNEVNKTMAVLNS
jgi:hypothetical protein